MPQRPDPSASSARRELGLDLLFLVQQWLLGTQHMHYGYFSDDLEPTLFNLPQAQDAHSALIISKIPSGVRRVLDVGCGAGSLSRKLVDAGFEVEALCPSPTLIARAQALVPEGARFHCARFEDFAPHDPFDLVLFSESFQYIKSELALAHCQAHLRPRGEVLICDFFKIPAEGKSPLGGGHYLPTVRGQLERAPYELLEDLDISLETSRTVDVFGAALKEVGAPAWELVNTYAETWHPWLTRLIRWSFRRKIEKFERKRLRGELNGESFRKHKSYRLMRLQLRSP